MITYSFFFSAIIAMLGSFLLGFGDSCLNTQNFSIIADMFPNDSAQTAALYKFTKVWYQ